MSVRASVILAHPKAGSLNHALAGAAVRGLERAGYEVAFHDLYAEDFDPRLKAQEVGSSDLADTLAATHARQLLEAWKIVVVHPVWFFHVPAMAKGWVDRVMREGVAFELTPDGVQGRLRARGALVVTTANATRGVRHEVPHDPVTAFWRECVFTPAGVPVTERLSLGPVRGSSAETRRAWLERVERAAYAG